MMLPALLVCALHVPAWAAPKHRPPPEPAENPTTKAKAELGKLLFFDKRLSLDNTVSCASCHDPKKGWTDQRPTPVGVRQQLGRRNTPSVLNAAYRETLFWDGRAHGLEAQAKEPIANPKEMALTHDAAAARITGIPGYARLFRSAFGSPVVTIDRITMALASFQRTLLAGNSSYDRGKLGPEAARGKELFNGKGNCAACHSGPDLSDGRFHNVGTGMQRRVQDLGRHEVTKADAERGAFRTPALRNLADTFPYMHDGSLATLAEVVEFFDKGGYPNLWLSPALKPLGLTAGEKQDLLAFLRALEGDKAYMTVPTSFPR